MKRIRHKVQLLEEHDKENQPPSDHNENFTSKKPKFFKNILNSPSNSPLVANKKAPLTSPQTSLHVRKFFFQNPISDVWKDDTTISNSFNKEQIHESAVSISNLSIIGKDNHREQCSVDEFDTAGNFNSTFIYPLHSTFKLSPTKSEISSALNLNTELEFNPTHKKIINTYTESTDEIDQCIQSSIDNHLEAQFNDNFVTSPLRYRGTISTLRRSNISRRVGNTSASPNSKRFIIYSRATKTNVVDGRIGDETTRRRISVVDSEDICMQISNMMSRESMSTQSEYVLTPNFKNYHARRENVCVSTRRDINRRSILREIIINTPQNTFNDSLTLISEATFNDTPDRRDRTYDTIQDQNRPKVTDQCTQTETKFVHNQRSYVNLRELSSNRVPIQHLNVYPSIEPNLLCSEFVESQRVSWPGIVSKKPDPVSSDSSDTNGTTTSKRRINKNKIMAVKSIVNNKSELIKNSEFSILAIF